ncbi:GNAT family N-acetyltransferase [Nocardioides koreensis]|uniref:GNAT family N-acetyltransferase n=1 Tax=Nocardioides koreensis TaxID=433651 RepID=UPI0031D2E4BA
MTIRPGRPSDLRHLAAVEDAGGPMFSDHFGPDLAPVLLSPAPSGLDRDLEPGFILVAVVGERVVGFAHVTDHEGHAHLEQLSVLPEHGRRGIGSALVRAAMEEARWSGYADMSLCTYRDVPWNGPFYARLGFVEVGHLAGYRQRLHDHEIALGLDADGVRVVMSRPLDR